MTESGKVQYVAGRDERGHSDATSSLVLALEAWSQKPVQMQSPISYMPFSPLGPWRSRLV